jgi:hypothetical protein
MNEDDKALDVFISHAFEKAIEDIQEYRFPLGSLRSLKLLYPPNSSPTLAILASIAYPTKATKPGPYFKVTLGVGQASVCRR